MEINKKKKLAAASSILSNVILTFLKIIAGIISGSISIISEAIHSLSDLFASVLTFFSVAKSSKPADEDHPYGHGKYEDMAGFIEGLLIVAAAIYIIYKAIEKIVLGVHSEIESNIGIIVMFVATISNFSVSSILIKVSNESNSISLYADAQHLRTDIYSSLGVLSGLVLIKVTGYSILDPVIAILVALFIFSAGFKISKKTWTNLLDHSLPYEDIDKIKQIVSGYSNYAILKENGIKARQVGPCWDIDLILKFREDITICECHKICDEIEKEIQKTYVNSSISIHSEPACYNKDCHITCQKQCNMMLKAQINE